MHTAGQDFTGARKSDRQDLPRHKKTISLMKIIYGAGKIVKFPRPVVALGVFDGLHLGHRRVLQAAVQQARRINGTSVVLTFWPHPQKKESLYSLKHRLRLIAQLGVEVTIVVKFSSSFAKISARDFIAGMLVKKIGADFVYVGKNFRFGRGGSGDYRLLINSAKQNRFTVKIFEIVKSGNATISSTQIRRLIKNFKIRQAQVLLGRPVSVSGTVIAGSRLGRILGFPTANIRPLHEVIPPAGIYCVRIIFSKKIYDGICYIGTRPTLKHKIKARRIEVHIFGFHKNIYGRMLEVQFIKLIRLDKKFSSLAALTAQIQKDIAACRKIR
jgi:riboflavin kinase / FMN adenylyltransferase